MYMSNVCEFCGSVVAEAVAEAGVYICKTTGSDGDDEYNMAHKECAERVFRGLPADFFEALPILRTMIVLLYDFESETLLLEKFTVDGLYRKHGLYQSWTSFSGGVKSVNEISYHVLYEEVLRGPLFCHLELTCSYVAGKLHGPYMSYGEIVKYINGSLVLEKRRCYC
jgi:hypothetical protein